MCNTVSMNEFLKQLSTQYSGYRIILILDKAGWHISQFLKLAENIQLLHLNPYSPEHNPVELLLREIQKKYFNNRVFISLGKVEETLQQSLLDYHQNKETVIKLSKGFLPN